MEPVEKFDYAKAHEFFERINRNSLKRSKIFQETIQNQGW